MKIPIENAKEVGRIIRASRKHQSLRQDVAAGSIGVSENFLVKVEKGSDTVQWGKLFQVMHGLGVRVILDIPDDAADLLKKVEVQSRGRR
jgi:transcriptional regulator with XRE-family HTH domain